MTRPDWNTYYLNMLPLVAARSTCLRRQIGAILTVNNRIIGTGYNGPPPGYPHCEQCIKDIKGYASGTHQLECPASHAELNAIAHCARHGVQTNGAHLYISVTPCSYCAKIIVQSGIHSVTVATHYPDTGYEQFFKYGNVNIYVACKLPAKKP